MSVYSGFATRQEESFYNKLLEKLVLLLSQKIIDLNPSLIESGDERFLKYIRKIYLTMSLMEKRKYLEPKFSSTTVKLLEHYGINIDLPRRTIYQNITFGRSHNESSNDSLMMEKPMRDIEIMSERLWDKNKRPTSEKIRNRLQVGDGIIEELEKTESSNAKDTPKYKNPSCNSLIERKMQCIKTAESHHQPHPPRTASRSRGRSQGGSGCRTLQSPVRRIMTAAGNKRRGNHNYIQNARIAPQRRTPPSIRPVPFHSIGVNYSHNHIQLSSPYVQKPYSKSNAENMNPRRKSHNTKMHIKKNMNIENIINYAKQTVFKNGIDASESDYSNVNSSNRLTTSNATTQENDSRTSIQANNL